MESFFDRIKLAPVDPILGITPRFMQDARPHKVNIGVGSYRTAEGQPFLMESIALAEERLMQNNMPKEYLPIDGNPRFLELTSHLVLGDKIDMGRIYPVQTIGGTGAINIAANFLFKNITQRVLVASPSWPNHEHIFQALGFELGTFPYYSTKTHKRLFAEMVQTLENQPEKTAIILQIACHNPTGSDLKLEEWKTLSEIIIRKKLLPILDNAYQGFGESVEKDASPIRLFYEQGIEMLVCSSYSKNFGLYGERLGMLLFVFNDPNTKKKIESQVKQIIRSIYSTPPIHGARLVATILQDEKLKKFWMDELENMRMRVKEMRQILASSLISKSGSPHYQFLEDEKGFFSLLGISKEVVEALEREKAIYLPDDGRINIAALTPHNVEYVIDSLLKIDNTGLKPLIAT